MAERGFGRTLQGVVNLGDLLLLPAVTLYLATLLLHARISPRHPLALVMRNGAARGRRS